MSNKNDTEADKVKGLKLFTLAGGINDVVPAGNLRVHPNNPIYFIDDSGKTVRLAGNSDYFQFQDKMWGGVYWLDRSPLNAPLPWNEYFDWMKARGMNYFRGWLSHNYGNGAAAGDPEKYCSPMPYERTGPGLALDGRPKFNLDKFNEDFFRQLHDRIEYAQSKGIYVSLMLFDVYGFLGRDVSWSGNVFHSANNVSGIEADANGDGIGMEFFYDSAFLGYQQAWVSKVIDAVNDLDNVIYEIANELYAPEWQTDMTYYVKNYEMRKPKQHLILRSPGGRTSSGDWGIETLDQVTDYSIADIFSIDQNWSQAYKDGNPPENTRNKPGIWDNDHMWPSDWKHYKHPWKAFTLGYHYNLYEEHNVGDNLYNPEWERCRYNVGATSAYAKKCTELANMSPKRNLSSTGYCLADPGNEYIVFNPDSSDSFTVSGLIKGGSYYYEWFDTYNCAISSTGYIACDTEQTFNPLFNNAVLYLKRSTE